MMKRILHLTLIKRYFDVIADGKKRREWRAKKPYWTKRLFKDGKPRKFDEVHFTNGYGRDRPFMRVEWRGLDLGCDDYYMVILGDLLEIRNWFGEADGRETIRS